MIKLFIVSLIFLVTLNLTIFEGQLSLGFFILFVGGWLGLDLLAFAAKEWQVSRFKLFGKKYYVGKPPKDWYK